MNNNAKKKAASKKELSKNQKIIIAAVAAVLAVALVAAFIIGLVNIIKQGKTLDYMKDDLSKYVYISPDDYKDYTVDINLMKADDVELQRKINALLVKHKSEEAKFDGAAVHKPDYVLKVGDVANVWYSGYVIEDGVRRDLPNMSNYVSNTVYNLELGSGNFIRGFEEAIIGSSMMEASFKKYTSGLVNMGDVVYVSYESYLPDGKTESETNKRIELGAEADKIYGKGFSKFLVGKTIGEKISDKMVFRVDGAVADTVYSSFTVNFATRTEADARQIELTFPENYKETSLRGLTVTFDIFVSTAILYDTPAFDDAFVSEKLKESLESLADYEGESLSEKYKSRLRKELEDEIKAQNNELIEEAMWSHLKDTAEFKKLPENEVATVYQQYFNEVNTYYQTYSNYYASLDQCAIDYFDLGEKDNWRSYITARAEDTIKEKILFYYIIREENIFPSDEDYKRIYDANMKEYMEYYTQLYSDELAECKTDEEREKKLAEIKENMMEYYGESYFEENVYYQYAMEVLVTYVKVK